MNTFDWEEFLEQAERLVGQKGDVAAARSAISRAYYAVFHEASRQYVKQGERLQLTGDDHTRVWEWFKREKSYAQFGVIGQRLKRSRRKADYEESFPGLSTEAQSNVKLARQLFDQLVALR